MKAVCLHDKGTIEQFLRRNTWLHLYELGDLDDLQSLYRISYPENWFDPRMLETGHYYGIRRDAKLVSVAGVHVYSPQYKIGVLGNVTTHPDYRGQRLGSAVCAKLCKVLLETVDHVG